MARIRLSGIAAEQDLHTLLDDEDADRLGERRISLGGHGYAQIYWRQRVELLHRWVLDLSRGDGLIGDHINGDPLDNRRVNLRAVTPGVSSQNVATRRAHRGAHRARSGRWTAIVGHQGKSMYLGTFDTAEEAAAVAEAKRRELFHAYAGDRTPTGPALRRDQRTAESRRQSAHANYLIRTWAAAQGIELARRGRLPIDVVAAYGQSNGGAR